MATIYQLVEQYFRPRDFIDYSNNVKTNNSVFAAIFPEIKKQTRKVNIFTSERTDGLAISAHVHASDALPEQASFQGKREHVVELLPITREFSLDELDLETEFYNLNGDTQREALRNNLFGRIRTDLVDSTQVRVERMRADSLQYGKQEISENGYDATGQYAIDYEAPKENFSDIDWKAKTSDPLGDLLQVQNDLETRQNVTANVILTSPEIVNYWTNLESVKKRLLGKEYEKLLTRQRLIQLLADEGLQVITDSRSYLDIVKGRLVEKRYLNPNKVIMMPNISLGNTIYGINAMETELGKFWSGAQTGFIGIGEVVDEYRMKKFIRSTATAMVAYPHANKVAVLDATIK